MSARSRGSARAVAVLGAVLLLGACQTQRVPVNAPRPAPAAAGASASPGAGSSAIHVVYESVSSEGDGGGVTMLLDELIDGGRLRLTQRDKAEPGRVLSVVVWDGHSLLIEEPEVGPPMRIAKPPVEQRPGPALMRPGDSAFARACPKHRIAGHVRIAGRAGTLYTCPAHAMDGEPVETAQRVLDDATGLTLREDSAGSHLLAVAVTVGVATDPSTFSTELPPAAPGATGPSGPLTSVESVPRVGGGTLELATIREGPSLVVIGELEGLKAMLAKVVPATHGGTRSRVYALLNAVPGSNWKGTLLNPQDEKRFVEEVAATVGPMPVPVGVDIKGGAAGEELRSFDQIMAGTTVLAAINADGSLAWRLTDTELAASPKKLNDWVAGNW